VAAGSRQENATQHHKEAFSSEVAADIGSTRYRSLNMRKSETSDLRGSRQENATNMKNATEAGAP
jgi:hypothetical protein